MAGAEQELPPCTCCGGCCYSTKPGYIGVYGVDLARMDERAASYTTVVGSGRRFMRFEGGCCSALQIDTAAGRCACDIYEQRPDACRWLRRGSAQCLALVRTRQS